jgi:hypothetical protein
MYAKLGGAIGPHFFFPKTGNEMRSQNSKNIAQWKQKKKYQTSFLTKMVQGEFHPQFGICVMGGFTAGSYPSLNQALPEKDCADLLNW